LFYLQDELILAAVSWMASFGMIVVYLSCNSCLYFQGEMAAKLFNKGTIMCVFKIEMNCQHKESFL